MVQSDPERAELYIRGILKDLCIRQGNDWTGWVAISNAGLDASIAAYERMLAEQGSGAPQVKKGITMMDQRELLTGNRLIALAPLKSGCPGGDGLFTHSEVRRDVI